MVGVQLPDGWLARDGDIVSQKEVEGVLLLGIGVGVVVVPAQAGQLVHDGGQSLPVPSLPLEDSAVSLGSPILHPLPQIRHARLRMRWHSMFTTKSVARLGASFSQATSLTLLWRWLSSHTLTFPRTSS